jgi:hypothetical protein
LSSKNNNDDYDICKSITESDEHILGTGILENMAVAAIYSKPNLPLPKEEKFQLMIIQAEIFISMAKSNTDFFGRLRYVTTSFESSDIVFFPLPSGADNKLRTLVVQILRPYDITKLLNKMHIV